LTTLALQWHPTALYMWGTLRSVPSVGRALTPIAQAKRTMQVSYMGFWDDSFLEAIT